MNAAKKLTVQEITKIILDNKLYGLSEGEASLCAQLLTDCKNIKVASQKMKIARTTRERYTRHIKEKINVISLNIALCYLYHDIIMIKRSNTQKKDFKCNPSKESGAA